MVLFYVKTKLNYSSAKIALLIIEGVAVENFIKCSRV